MPGFSAYLQKAALDWILGGATPTQPAGCWAGLAIGTPTSVSAGELGTATGYSRLTALFGPAASPAGSVTAAPLTFGPFSSSCSVLGCVLFDSSGGGNLLVYGTLQTARTYIPSDVAIFTQGALSVVLS